MRLIMRRALERNWPRSQTWRAIIIATLVLIPIALAFVTLVDDWSNVSKIKDVAGAVQSAVTVIAIVAGGIFALFKLQAFRDFEPHLTISHEVSHRQIGNSYVHVAVTSTLHNGSKVKLDFLQAFIRLQQISPTSDAEVESLYTSTFVDREHEDIPWPILYEVPRIWDVNELIIEPGESHQESYEFIVSTEVESVIVYTYYYNSRGDSEAPEGWGATSVYDIFSGSNP